jgi:phage shock protein PspC (stress-responsive transcriptional regulator)
MDETKRCPFCAEEIRSVAVRCPHCRSRLASFELEGWHRGHDDARLAGVATAVAHSLSLPVGAVRLGFALLSLVHLIGAMAYGALWLIVPPRAGEPSLLEEGLARAGVWARWLAGGGREEKSHRSPAYPGDVADLPKSVISGGDGER